MQVCTLLQTDNHASTSPLSFLQAECPSCRPTNSVKALKAKIRYIDVLNNNDNINVIIPGFVSDLRVTIVKNLCFSEHAGWTKKAGP